MSSFILLTVRYEKLFVLHTLWTAYIDDLMGDKFMAGKLLKADLHGAIIKGETFLTLVPR